MHTVFTFALLVPPFGALFVATQRSRFGSQLRRALAAALAGSRPLAQLALLSLLVAALSLVMQAFDARQLLGASVWLKPAKFGISIAIASFSLALLLPKLALPAKARRRTVGLIVSLLALELVIITIQAARGLGSHFNYATRLDAALFQVMGVGITIATAAIGYLGVRAFRTRFDDRALGWGVRFGFAAMLLGSVIAFLMPHPTAEQLASLRAGKPTLVIGAHAVGVRDGGPGLPLTGWSSEGGDLRIPHFIGLHGLQIVPLLGWWLSRRRMQQALAARLTIIAGVGYLGLVVTTLQQALRAQPWLAPDALTVDLGAAVGVACALAALVSGLAASRAAAHETQPHGAAPDRQVRRVTARAV